MTTSPAVASATHRCDCDPGSAAGEEARERPFGVSPRRLTGWIARRCWAQRRWWRADRTPTGRRPGPTSPRPIIAEARPIRVIAVSSVGVDQPRQVPAARRRPVAVPGELVDERAVRAAVRPHQFQRDQPGEVDLQLRVTPSRAARAIGGG